MELHTWLDEEAGRATALAALLGIGKAAVSLWRDAGVPLLHMGLVSEFSEGAVSVSDMVAHTIACRMRRARAAACKQSDAATSAPA